MWPWKCATIVTFAFPFLIFVCWRVNLRFSISLCVFQVLDFQWFEGLTLTPYFLLIDFFVLDVLDFRGLCLLMWWCTLTFVLLITRCSSITIFSFFHYLNYERTLSTNERAFSTNSLNMSEHSSNATVERGSGALEQCDREIVRRS